MGAACAPDYRLSHIDLRGGASATPEAGTGSTTPRAELIVVPEDNFVAHKPAGVELVAAGAAPWAGITALAALDALGVSEGDTILVIGANGDVGSFAVQFALNAGATVIAPTLPEDEDARTTAGATRLPLCALPDRMIPGQGITLLFA
jgi:NADPH:quinone reductase-like Zn-dependent oxidoreductase